nr:hypothetical protein BGP89_02785 [Luteimonas sp. JM171]
MSEASMTREPAVAAGGPGTAGQPRRMVMKIACLVAGVLAFALPLLWLAGPERSFADTLAVAAWAWLLLGAPLVVLLVVGGIGAARRGQEPRLVGVAQWFAIGMATGVVLLELQRLFL